MAKPISKPKNTEVEPKFAGEKFYDVLTDKLVLNEEVQMYPCKTIEEAIDSIDNTEPFIDGVAHIYEIRYIGTIKENKFFEQKMF